MRAGMLRIVPIRAVRQMRAGMLRIVPIRAVRDGADCSNPSGPADAGKDARGPTSLVYRIESSLHQCSYFSLHFVF